MRRDPAQHLAVIERLRSRAFPSEPAAEPGVADGPAVAVTVAATGGATFGATGGINGGAADGSPGGISGGPGYHLAELAVSAGFWADDGTARPAAAEQYEAERAALSLLLTARWGEPQLLGMQGVLLRAAEGEEVPQPWRELSGTADYAELWRAERHWIAVAVAGRDPYQPLRLLAAVTVNDPP